MINIDQSIFPFNMPKVSRAVQNDSSASVLQDIGINLKNDEQENKEFERLNNFKSKLKISMAVLFGVFAAAILLAFKGVKNKMTLEQFKSQKGRFDKGIAKIKNQPYSGSIIVEKNNRKFILNYKEGRIVQSTCFKKFDCIEKPFFYMNDFRKKYSYGIDYRVIKHYKYTMDGMEYLAQKTTFNADEVVSEKSNRYINRNLKSRVKIYPNGDVFSASEVIEKTNNPKAFRIKTVNSATGEVLNSEIVLSNKQTVEDFVNELWGDNVLETKKGKIIQIDKIGTNESGEKFAIVNDGSGSKKVVLEPKK